MRSMIGRFISLLLLLCCKQFLGSWMARQVRFAENPTSNELPYDPLNPSIAIGLSCVECSMPLPYENQPYATLKPCDHLMCSACLGACLATKPPTAHLFCARCEDVISSHVPHKIVFTGGNQEFLEMNEVQHAVRIARDVYNDPNKDKDPLRYWFKNVPEDNRIGKGILYYAHMERNEYGESILSDPITCHFNVDGGYCCSSRDEETLEEILRRLHRVVFPQFPLQQGKFNSIPELVDLIVNDDDLAIRTLYAFGGGVRLTPDVRELIKREGSGYIRSDLLAAFVAKSALLQFQANQQGNHRTVGLLQQMVGDIVFSLGAEQKTIDLLCEFRLSASLSHLKRLSDSALKGLLIEEPLIPPLSFVSTCFDNFDVMKKGRNAKMVNWVIMSLMQTAEEKVRDMGFYAEDESCRISREGQTLEEFKEKCAESDLDWIVEMVGVRKEDLADFSFYSMTYMSCALGLPLPSLDTCSTYEEAGTYSSCTTEIPRNLGIDVHPRTFEDRAEKYQRFKPRQYDPSNEPSDYYQYLASIDDDNIDSHSMLSLNNVSIDVPLKDDLNKKSVVVRYLDALLEMNEDQLEGYTVPDGHEPPVAEVMMAHTADGSPVYNAHTVFDLDAQQANPKYKKLRVFPGGFHCTKEHIEKKHALNDVFVRRSIRGFRESSNQQDKYMYPHDPNQFEQEEIQRIIAIFRSAAESYGEGVGKSDVSPAEVNKYMLDCANDHPDSMAVLIDARLSIIYFMMRDAERCNSIELFFTAIRLALPLFAATDATKYVRICVELLLWRATASQAEIVLFRETAFTRETPGKKHIFVDRAQEKINGVVRSEVGDCVRPGHDQKVLKTALHLADIIERKQGVKEAKGIEIHKSSGPFNESTVSVDEVYVSVRLAMAEMKVWDYNRPTGDNMLETPDGEMMPSEFLQFWSIGTRRLREYTIAFYHDTRYSVARPTTYATGGVPLSRLRSLPSDLIVDESQRRTLLTSISATELKDAAKGKKLPLITEIMRLGIDLIEHPESITFDENWLKNRRKVSQLAEDLVMCRKAYIQQLQQQQQDVSSIFEALVADDLSMCDAFSNPELRAEELDTFFYQLCPVQVALFNESIQLKFYS